MHNVHCCITYNSQGVEECLVSINTRIKKISVGVCRYICVSVCVCVCVCVCTRTCVLNCVWLFAIPWTVAHQTPLSMEFSRQEYQSGLPFPTPGDLPDPGIEPTFPTSAALAGRFFTTVPPGKCIYICVYVYI